MKINWFCPLPPARSGIAVDFFRTIFPALSSRAEVTLWTDQTSWVSTLESYARVQPFSLQNMPWLELNRADTTFFNLGNNHLFHGTIWEVSRLLPGIIILHDFRLDEFFANWKPCDWSAWRESRAPVEHSSGDLGFALDNSLAIVVHAQEAFEHLNALNRWIVAHLPLPFSLPASYKSTPRREKRMPPYRLIVFGFIHQNRRVPELLQALGTFPYRDKFQLEIYGELWDRGLVEQTIRKYNLPQQVRIRGFVSEAALDDALAAADLAVNLRYPSTEASGSQLRIWSHGLPSIVTHAGWFAELPETAVAHVDPENEIAHIQQHLQNFLSDPAMFACMGAEGKRLLYPTHAPENYVDGLLNLAEQAIEFRPRAAAHRLARRTGESIAPWLGTLRTDDSLRRVAEELICLTGGGV